MIKPTASLRPLRCAVVTLGCLCLVPSGAIAQTADPVAPATTNYTEITRKQVELTDQKLTRIQIAPPLLPRSIPDAHRRMVCLSCWDNYHHFLCSF